jgi:hypothetical protein
MVLQMLAEYQKLVQTFGLGLAMIVVVVVQRPLQPQDPDKLSFDVSIRNTQSTKRLGHPHY